LDAVAEAVQILYGYAAERLLVRGPLPATGLVDRPGRRRRARWSPGRSDLQLARAIRLATIAVMTVAVVLAAHSL
jgi:hypothetical protein